MKEIRLTRGLVTIVDDDDFEKVGHLKWQAGSEGYAQRSFCRKAREGGGSYTVKLHRMICGVTSDLVVDHINGDRLDNRKCNLRICKRTENIKNTVRRRGGSSQFKGVRFRKDNRMWTAQIGLNGKPHHIGSFESEREAALAYDAAAKEFYGEFANLNFPNQCSGVTNEN